MSIENVLTHNVLKRNEKLTNKTLCSLFLIKKDWRECKFTRDNVVKLQRHNQVYMCLRANHMSGTCKHALCSECYVKQSSQQSRRKREKPDSNEQLKKCCNHELRNLQMVENIWWCQEDRIEGKDWIGRPQGCVCCEGMFIVS